MATSLEPVEGKVQVKFLDDDDDAAASDESREQSFEYAMVLAAGKKTGVKPGDVVLVSAWARSCPKLDDGSCLISNWDIQAKVKA